MVSSGSSFFPFQGYLGRSRYSMEMAGYLILNLVANLVIGFLDQVFFESSALGIILCLFSILLFVIVTLFSFCSTIKRLRDVELNPRFSIILLVPILNLLFVIWLCCKAGKHSSAHSGQ